MSIEPKYMLDTNICIYIRRQKQPSIMEHLKKVRPGRLVISTITWGELVHGAMKSQKTKQVLKELDEFATLIPVCAMSPDCGWYYGEIKSDLEKRGLLISGNDMWIAAHALALNLTLVTNNSREFERIPRLKLENWV